MTSHHAHDGFGSDQGHATLVTGGAGFVGSHLVERLLADGHEVTVLDGFSTGSSSNLEHVADHPGLRVIEGRVTCPYDFAGVGSIYDLARPASPRHYQADPIEMVLTNVRGTLHELELVRKTGGRVLKASTREGT